MKNYFTHVSICTCSLILTFILFDFTATSQIIYTDLVPDSLLDVNGDIYHLDLNNDGTFDFNLSLTKSTVTGSNCVGTRTRRNVTVTPVDSLKDAVANLSYAGVNYAPPIGPDTIIDSASFIWLGNSNQNLANITWVCSGTKPHRVWHSTITGKWGSATDKFLGLRIKVGNNTYYGWVRLSIGSTSFTVKDYAYNSAPDQLIYSGQSTTEFLTVSPLTSTSLCAGDSLDIGFTVFGNFDSTNVFTAQLSDSSGSFLNPVNIGSLTGNTSGTINVVIPPGTIYSLLYHIRVIASSPVGVSNFNYANLFINNALPLNHITTNYSLICDGDSSYFIVQPQSGNSYQWSFDNSIIFDETNYYIYCHSAGSYRCTITNACGSIVSDSAIVEFLPSPVANINTVGALWICPGDTVRFFADSLAGQTYYWFHNNSVVASYSQYNAVDAGIYYVMVRDSAGCYRNSDMDTVVISNPYSSIIAGGPIAFCNGDSVLLSLNAAADTSFTFQWFNSNNLIPGASNAEYYATQTGTYSLAVTNPYGNCDATSNEIDVLAVCDGIGKTISLNTHFTLSPNPANHFLEIKQQTEKAANVQIVNHLGQIIYFDKINSSQKLIDVSNFSEGIYFVKWTEDTFSESKQFTVVK